VLRFQSSAPSTSWHTVPVAGSAFVFKRLECGAVTRPGTRMWQRTWGSPASINQSMHNPAMTCSDHTWSSSDAKTVHGDICLHTYHRASNMSAQPSSFPPFPPPSLPPPQPLPPPPAIPTCQGALCCCHVSLSRGAPASALMLLLPVTSILPESW
jgi:hypothetical protein